MGLISPHIPTTTTPVSQDPQSDMDRYTKHRGMDRYTQAVPANVFNCLGPRNKLN